MIDLLATTVRRLIKDGNRRGLEVVSIPPKRGGRKVVDCFPRRKDLEERWPSSGRWGKLDGFVPAPIYDPNSQVEKPALRCGVRGVGLRLLFYGPAERDPAAVCGVAGRGGPPRQKGKI